MERPDLENLSREGLIALAENVGVTRPRVLTQPELIDEIISRTVRGDRERTRARGWLGIARDLVARVIEKGLHLPQTARELSRAPTPRWPDPPQPLATVTLAEIYAAQGHLRRALSVTEDVLAREPEHAVAQKLRAGLLERIAAAKASEAPSAEVANEDTDAREDAPTDATILEESSANAVNAELDADADASAALPTRYDVDEVVGIAVDPRTLYIYWELRPSTLAHAQARQPEGRLVLRIVSVLPSWDGPLSTTSDLPIDALDGDLYVLDVTPGADVRISMGWRGATYEPLAVGIDITAPTDAPIEPDPVVDVATWAHTSAIPVAATAEAWRRSPVLQRGADSAHTTPTVSLSMAREVVGGHEEVVERYRTRRLIPGGASELAFSDDDHTRRRVRVSPFGTLGSSELTRGRSSSLSRR